MVERKNMAEDKINGNEALTQNGMDNNKKESETKNINGDKENEAFVQVSLSILGGIVGGAWANILDKDLWINVLTITVAGFIVYATITWHDKKLDKKIGFPILIVLLLIIMALLACLAYCIHK